MTFKKKNCSSTYNLYNGDWNAKNTKDFPLKSSHTHLKVFAWGNNLLLMGMLHYGYFLIAQNKSIYSSTETHVDWTKTFGTILFTPFRNSSNFIVGWNSTTTDTIFWGSRFIWIGGCSWNLRCSFFSLFSRTFSLCRSWLSWWSWIIIVGAKFRRKIIFWNSSFLWKKLLGLDFYVCTWSKIFLQSTSNARSSIGISSPAISRDISPLQNALVAINVVGQLELQLKNSRLVIRQNILIFIAWNGFEWNSKNGIF